MPRNISPAMQAEIRRKEVQPVVMYEGEFDSGNVNLWAGAGVIYWQDKEWTGGGQLLQIGSIEETEEISTKNFKVSISPLPLELSRTIRDESYHGSKCRIYLGAFDNETGNIVNDPFLLFTGRLINASLLVTGNQLKADLNYSSRLFDPTASKVWRNTDQDHKTLFPGDETFRYVAGLQRIQEGIKWGRT